MACDCMKQMKGRLTEHIREKKEIAPENVISARFDGEVLALEDNGLVARLVMPFTLRYRWLTKAGKEKESKVESSLALTFCPWCGKKYKEDAPEQENRIEHTRREYHTESTTPSLQQVLRATGTDKLFEPDKE